MRTHIDLDIDEKQIESKSLLKVLFLYRNLLASLYSNVYLTLILITDIEVNPVEGGEVYLCKWD